MSDRSMAETRVGETAAAMVIIWAGFPLAGAIGGWLVKAAAGWVADLPWAPFQGPLSLIAEYTGAEPQASLIALAVGGLLGLAFALHSAGELLSVTVTDGEVRVRRGESEEHIDRAEIAAAFLDAKDLVLLDSSGAERLREPCDHPAERLGPAFTAHGYPWTDDDPYAAEFRRWVPGLPDLPTGADAMLSARERALSSGDKAEAAALREEINALGIAVRDRDKRQHWRRITHRR